MVFDESHPLYAKLYDNNDVSVYTTDNNIVVMKAGQLTVVNLNTKGEPETSQTLLFQQISTIDVDYRSLTITLNYDVTIHYINSMVITCANMESLVEIHEAIANEWDMAVNND